MGKTGGDATAAMFQVFPELLIHADPPGGQAKHARFGDREEWIEGKLLAANTRRLPTWTLSWAHHINLFYTRRNGQLVPMLSPHEMAELDQRDRSIKRFTDNGRFPVTRWLRQEHLATDFLDFVSELTEVNEEQHRAVLEIGSVNTMAYDHELAHWFTPDQIKRMYEVNPLCASIELEVYGDLLELEEVPPAPTTARDA
jgi:hypothetical protein